jgi:hypothetical protein
MLVIQSNTSFSRKSPQTSGDRKIEPRKQREKKREKGMTLTLLRTLFTSVPSVVSLPAVVAQRRHGGQIAFFLRFPSLSFQKLHNRQSDYEHEQSERTSAQKRNQHLFDENVLVLISHCGS